MPASDELVYRVADASASDLLKMNPGRPARAAEYEHRPPSMREVDEAEARRLVINGGNLLCVGIAGVGKRISRSPWCKNCARWGRASPSCRRRTWPRNALEAAQQIIGVVVMCFMDHRPWPWSGLTKPIK